MLLTIAFYLSKTTHYLKKNFNYFLDLLNQNQKNIELIIIDDDSDYNLFKTLKPLIENTNAKIKYFYLNETQGNAYAYNLATKYAHGKYIWYLGGHVELNLDASSLLFSVLEKDYDVISFNLNDNVNQNPSSVFDSLNKDILVGLWESVSNKIIALDFIRKNKLAFYNDKWYPALFIYDLFTKFNSWRNVNVNFISNNSGEVGYNVYDLLQQINELYIRFSNDDLLDLYKDELCYWITGICFHSFLKKIYEIYTININSKKQIKERTMIISHALSNAKKYLETHFANFENNLYVRKFKVNILKYYLKSKQGLN
ncbi:glycosyltransferase family A protein [Ureaplasma parvum]|uniref:glycosyltransferase family A protein n=1 Tax=Ureaplasma parvum TaxID=134821 RepID=UPI0026ECAFAB|nr:glycosyltransferase family 2 protein [Ureaplasma parvum]